jgi:hypothetical protein
MPLTAQAQSHRAPTRDPQVIALTPRDLPGGFVRSLARHTTNAAIARENGVPLKIYTDMGREIGYEVAFRRASSSTCCIDVQVVRYRTAAGATRAFSLGQQMVANSYATLAGFHSMYDSSGSSGLQTFTRTVARQRQAVSIVTSHVGRYLISTELHFRPGTARTAMIAAALRYQRVMLARTPGGGTVRLISRTAWT